MTEICRNTLHTMYRDKSTCCIYFHIQKVFICKLISIPCFSVSVFPQKKKLSTYMNIVLTRKICVGSVNNLSKYLRLETLEMLEENWITCC